MKKLLKFFPVAVAAVALASCSNDELFLGADNEPQKDPTKLYAQIEDLTDGETGEVTRSGFVYSYDANTPNGQVFVWTEGDKVKLYDDLKNWRPQIWTYDEAATIAYAQSGSKFGFAVFENNTTETDLPGVVKAKDANGQLLPQYKNAYGVMPYDLAEFANENRTAVKFDFSKLAYYATGLNSETASAANNLKYNPAKLSKAPIPLWAVANGQEMKVNYLTGILKVDIDNIANLPGTVDGNANTHQFLIIQSKADATDGFYMHPTATQVPALAEVAFTPDVAGAAPAVTSTTTGITATDVTAAAMATTDLSNIPADLIVVDLGDVVDGRVQVSVPLLPGKQYVKAFVKKNVDITNASSVNLQNPDAIIADAKEFTVAAAKYYRIQDPGLVKISTLNNPYSVAQYIINQDPLQTRDWTLQLEADVDVKTGGAGADANNFVLDLSAYALKHNVTIKFADGFGLKKNADTDKLVIKTAQSDKNLKIVGTTTSTVENIEIDATAAGKIELTGILKNIINKADNVLTVTDGQTGAGGTAITTSGDMTFNAYGKAANNVNILNGCEHLYVKNGSINQTWFGSASEKFNTAVDIYTEGTGYVGFIDYNYVATNGQSDAAKLKFADAANITYSSKLTIEPASLGGGYCTTPTTFSNVKLLGQDGTKTKAIISAAQLAKCTSSDGILMANVDLGGNENILWTPLAAATLDGNQAVVPTTSTMPSYSDSPVATISNMKLASSTNSGLFASLTTQVVKNLVFDGVKMEGAVADGDIFGVLAGTVSGAAAISNIEVKNLAVDVTTSNNAISAGGLIGKVTSTTVTTINNVKTAGSIKAWGNLGGIVGLVEKNAKVTFGTKTDDGGTPVKSYITNPCSSTVTFTPEKSNTNNSPYYAKIGEFIGSVTSASDMSAAVVINLNSYTETARTVDTKAQAASLNTDTGDNVYHAITMNQSLVGYSGFYNATSGNWNNPTAMGNSWAVTVNVCDATTNAAKKVATVNSYRVTQVASPAATDKILCSVAE